MLVAHDELDLLPGEAKMKLGGGVAGHNGLKDIRAQLGTADFWRLRLGIGHPRDSAHSAAAGRRLRAEAAARGGASRDRRCDRARLSACGRCLRPATIERAMTMLHTKESK